MQFGEAVILWKLYHSYPGRHEFLIGTIFLGVGVTVMVLAKPEFNSGGVISKWGRYTLGIYVLHYYFIDLLEPVNKAFNNTLWEMAFPMIIYTLTLTTVYFLTKSKMLRPFVV